MCNLTMCNNCGSEKILASGLCSKCYNKIRYKHKKDEIKTRRINNKIEKQIKIISKTILKEVKTIILRLESGWVDLWDILDIINLWEKITWKDISCYDEYNSGKQVFLMWNDILVIDSYMNNKVKKRYTRLKK